MLISSKIKLVIILCFQSIFIFGQKYASGESNSSPTDLISSRSVSCARIDTQKCYVNKSFPTVDFAITKVLESEASTSLYQSPLLADIDNDCIPEIIMSGLTNFHTNPRITSGIEIVDTKSGATKRTIETPFYAWGGPTSFAVADINNDGFPEIVLATAGESQNQFGLRSRLVCYDAFGNLLWVSDQTYGNNVNGKGYGASPGFADFNHDGIPEVYIYNEIFNALTGVKLVDGGNNGTGSVIASFNSYAYGSSVAAELDNNPSSLELAAGYTIYNVSINNINGTTGNFMTARNLAVDNQFRDGFTSIGDINTDGRLDVIVSAQGSSSTSRLYVYTLENNTSVLLAKTTLPSNGQGCCPTHVGPAFVGDIDGSGRPSIGVTRSYLLMTYHYNGTTNLQEFWRISTNDESGSTGMTMFDFNQDGVQEIVYRDENSLRIMNGSVRPPVNLASFPCSSGTGLEYPIVGDIDFTGESKICVPCGQNSFRTGRINIFGAPAGRQPWAPSRGIWNQYSYHVFNINDDLTIPEIPSNNAINAHGRFNNFLVQASLLDSMGNFLQTAVNLSGEIVCVHYDAVNNLYSVTFNIRNLQTASAAMPGNLKIAFFNGNPETNGTLIGIYTINLNLPPGSEIKDITYTFSTSDLKELYMVINSNGEKTGTAYSPDDFLITECEYQNNIIFSTSILETVAFFQKICEGDSLYFNSHWLKASGEYIQVKPSFQGCDTIVQLYLQVLDNISLSSDHKVCTGDSIFLENEWIFEDKTILIKTSSSQGCDSTYQYFVTFHEPQTNTETILLCSGDSIFLNNKWHYSDINIQDTLHTLPCPTFTNKTLTFFPSYNNTDMSILCPGDSIFFQNNWYTESGEFLVSHKTKRGCDSNFVLILNHIEAPEAPALEADCDQYKYLANIEADSNWQILWSNGSTDSSTEFPDSLSGNVTLLHNFLECRLIYTFVLENIPARDESLFLKDTIVFPGKPIQLHLPLNENLWNILWRPSSIMSCDTCFSNIISTRFDSDIFLTLYHISGCQYEYSFKVLVDNSLDIIIPNIFSPEGSSPNNAWNWLIPDCFYVQTVSVYDRWGNLVFLLKNPVSVGWNGIFKGQIAEQGVYVFVTTYIRPDGSVITRSGDVTLIRL